MQNVILLVKLLLFVVVNVGSSFIIASKLDFLQRDIYKKAYAISILEGGYVWYFLSFILIFSILGSYFVFNKRKIVFSLMFIPILLIVMGFRQYLTVDSEKIVVANLFKERIVRFEELESLVTKYKETHLGEGGVECSDFNFIRLKNGEDISVVNFSHPPEKLFEQVKLHKPSVKINCEIHWEGCRENNLSSNKMCQKTIDKIGGLE